MEFSQDQNLILASQHYDQQHSMILNRLIQFFWQPEQGTDKRNGSVQSQVSMRGTSGED